MSKFEHLKSYLKDRSEQGICLAFSGGIDSTLLLYLCRNYNVTAITLKSIFQTEEELIQTQILCNKYNVKQVIIDFSPLTNPILAENPKDRCYYCKKIFFTNIVNYAQTNNLKYIIDGTNYDDLNVFRPGLKALKELDIISPLAEFKITKSEIREYAKHIGIETFNKPSTPCLATRFPYGTKLNEKLIHIVEEGEKIIKSYGFINTRLRIHNNIARIEIPKEEFEKFISLYTNITLKIKKLGINYVTLDLEGLRSGSMDLY